MDRKDSGRIWDGFLVLQYRMGDPKALKALVNRYHKKLCLHAYRYTGDLETAADIVQECWTIVLRKLHRLRDPDKFGSWAMTIVTRKSLDHINTLQIERKKRKEWVYNGEVMTATNPEAELKEKQLQALHEGIATLAPDQQQVLRLFYLEEFSLKEISGIMGIKTGTVKSRLFHAREKLKLILKQYQ